MPQSVSFGRRAVAANVAVPAPRDVALPRLPKIELPQTGRAARVLARVPWFSLGLFLLLLVVFEGELSAGSYTRGGALSLSSLIAVGGVSRTLVLSGEWWRLFTAPLLHGSWEHILSNGFVLVLDGYFLESLIGRRWYAATFAIGAVAGAAASIALNAPGIVSVGASGGIMALLGATFVCSFGDAVEEKRARRMRRISLRLLLPSLIPLAAQVDTNAHLGGAFAGGCIGFFLQTVWAEGEERPPLARFAGAASVAFVALASISFVLVSFNFAHFKVGADPVTEAADMIPNDQLQAAPLTLAERSDELVTRFPRDPRAHMYHALKYRLVRDFTDSEEELRQAIALNGENNDTLGKFLELELALTLLREGRAPEAKDVARPACSYLKVIADDGEDFSDGRELRAAGVCD